jgi:hypothetical protein
MRIAELLMAVVMGIFSVYLMWKSAELDIGWIANEGPGGGAWPFWLAAVMLGSCLWIIFRWVRKTSPLSRSSEAYVDKGSLIDVVLVAGSLTVTIALFHIIGVYGALPLFLIFYLRVMGRHSWRLTLITMTAVPVTTFFFFEIALKITLPKGYTEPLFYPLYKIFL